MATLSGTYHLGPDLGHLYLRTTREGMAARVGHDLQLEITRWSGTLIVDSDVPDRSALEVEADLTSITVLAGTGGVMDLTEKDKTEIAKNARKALGVDAFPTASFRATAMPSSTEHGRIEGILTLHDSSGPLHLDFDQGEGPVWRARGQVTQTEFGIKPFKGMLGALRVADIVTVDIELRLGAS
ncbi:MAG: YceI family protein [Sporichthyaceae bacterium]